MRQSICIEIPVLVRKAFPTEGLMRVTFEVGAFLVLGI